MIVALLVCFAGCHLEPKPVLKCPGPDPLWADSEKIEPPGTKYVTFSSQVAKTSVSYLVYLPPAYAADSTTRYPVVYWLHGMCGRASQGSAFVHQLDNAIRANQAHPVIAVLVNGMSDSWYFDSFDGKWPVESVIIKDLIPHIDRTYRTIASREARGVEGFSMGGFGAAHLAFKFPEMFGVATLNAAAFNSLAEFRQGIPEVSAKIFGADSSYFARNEPRALLEQNAAKIRDRMTIRIAIGDLDRLQQANQGVHELLNRLRIDHEFEMVPGVDHNRQLFYDRLRDRAFRHYGRAFIPCVSDAGRICK